MQRTPEPKALAWHFLAAWTMLTLPPAAPAAAPLPPQPRIVNGVPSDAYPAVGALISPSSGATFCTVSMIGCQTVLTAGHCVCGQGNDGPACPDGSKLVDPATLRVYLPQAGLFSISAISVAPNYDFGESGDVALLQLGAPIEGLAPLPINTVASPGFGTPGTLVGYGVTNFGAADDAGIKRRGKVVTASCDGSVPEAEHLCWNFEAPVGPPGEDSNSCVGDSGGPMLVSAGGQMVIAGVTSGGFSNDCQAPDLSYDADIFVNSVWLLTTGGADISATRCGLLPAIGEPGAASEFFAGTLAATARFTVDVPPGTAVLRAGLNGEETDSGNDFDLYLRFGSEASTFEHDCASRRNGAYEFCQIDRPEPGTWHLLLDNFDGDGGVYQLSVTTFAGPAESHSVPALHALPAGIAVLTLLAAAGRLRRKTRPG